MRKKTKIVNTPIIVEKDREGYFASCPSIQGCYTQGDTYDEVMLNIRDAVKLCLEDEKNLGRFSISTSTSLTSI